MIEEEILEIFLGREGAYLILDKNIIEKKISLVCSKQYMPFAKWLRNKISNRTRTFY